MSDGNLNSENPYVPVQIPAVTRAKSYRRIYIVASILVLAVHAAQYVYLRIYHDLRIENGTIMFDVHTGPAPGGQMVFSHSTYSTNFFSAAAAIMISVAFVNFVIWSMLKWLSSRRAKPELI